MRFLIHFLLIILLIPAGMSHGESLNKHETERTELIAEEYQTITNRKKVKSGYAASSYHISFKPLVYQQRPGDCSFVFSKQKVYLLHRTLII